MLNGKNHPLFTGYEDISGRYWARIIYSAKKRNIDFHLDIKEAWNIYEKQERKCALSGVDIHIDPIRTKETTASLDRRDNTKGYEVDNVQWLHKHVNILKQDYSEKYLFDICKNIHLSQMKKEKDWQKYFMNLAQMVATRSKDPTTHHGCIITDSNHRVISCGYNGPIQGIDDSLIPKTRPAKYFHTIHSEENAILFAKRDLAGCYAFITGIPCTTCARMLIQAGIVKIFYGNLTAKMCDKESREVVEFFCKQKKVELINVN